MSSDRRTLFTVAWTLCALSMLWVDSPEWIRDPASFTGAVALAACAVVALSRPGAWYALPLLAAGALLFLVARMPFMPNHFHFAALLNSGILLACLRRDPERGLAEIVPLGRWMLILLYFFAVLHKLNWDYFDPTVSSAWAIHLEIVEQRLPFLPAWPWLAEPVIWLSLAVEVAIPLLLVFSRTRGAGIWTALLFHGFLAFTPIRYVLDFTVMTLALMTLFLSESEAERIRAAERARSKRIAGRFPRWSRRLGGAGAALATAAAVLLLLLDHPRAELITVRAFHLYGFALCAWFTVAVAWPLLRTHPAPTPPPAGDFRLRPSPAALALALMLANGFAPYTGWKSQMSFSMFSNLRSDDGRTNHLFLPMLSKGPGDRARAVEILEVNHPTLQWVAARGDRVTWFEARRHLSEFEDAHMVWREGGRTYTADRRTDPDHELFAPLAWWERKLVIYRTAVPPEDVPVPHRH